jgi:PAS domain S-box-containing protein
MRVGTKLLLLAMLPVCSVFALVVVSAVSDYRTASRLSSYRAKARLSFALAPLAIDLAHERRAAVLARLEPGAAANAQLIAFERATTRGFEQARAIALHVAAPVDVVGALDAARRQRQALVLQLEAGSLDPRQAIAGYSLITQNVLNLVASLDAGAPSPTSARAAAAYGPMLQAIESASHERAFVITLLARRGARAQPTASPWATLEAAELNEFRQNATGPLAADLESVLFSPAGVAVRRFRDELAANPAVAVRSISLPKWLSISETRVNALRGVAAATGRSLVSAVSNGVDTAHTKAARDLALSLAFFALVTALALALRRSITGPLQEVSSAARGLAHGDVSAEVEYSSRDEIGDVAAAFRDVHATAKRLVDEIRAKNRAVRENRLEHRADLSGLEGVWSQLMGGMNETMASFAELQGRREQAERETARIFEMSLDLLCVIGFDGYFKRVNPAFERTLGYPREVLLSRTGFDFTHPDDLDRSRKIFSALSQGEQVERFDNRNVCADGSVRWLEWSAQPLVEQGLVYAVARDITETRRAAEEQAALRRVATLVARGAAPDLVIAAVAEEAGKLLSADIALIGRYGAGPTVTAIAGWRPDGKPVPLGTAVRLGGRNVMSLVFSVGGPARLEAYSKATGELGTLARASGVGSAVGVPIEVEGRLWGVMMVSLEHEARWPPGTEEQLARFTDLAATAIANADAREELRHVAAEQSALRRVATLVAQGVAPELVFNAVAGEVGKLLPGVDLALIARYRPEQSVEFVGGWSSVDEPGWVGTTVRIGGQNVSTAVFQTEQPARIDRLDDDAMPLTGVARGAGARSSAGAPIKIEGQLWGVMIVASVDEDTLPAGIELELAGFTDLVATAIANTQAREEVAASRARVVAAADEARRRLERDLHDGVQQRLVVLGLQLQAARELANGTPVARDQLAQVGQGLTNVVEELREISSGIHPVVLRHGGLRAGVRALARRSPVPVTVDVPADLDLPDPVEVAAYYVASEAVTNAAKHADASSMEICVGVNERVLELTIRDDGVGGARVGAGSGLIGLADRVQAVGGRIEIVSPQAGGTTIHVTLPLAPVPAQSMGEPV